MNTYFRCGKLVVILGALMAAGCPPDGSTDAATDAPLNEGGALDARITPGPAACPSGATSTIVDTVDSTGSCPTHVTIDYGPSDPWECVDLTGCCAWPTSCRFDVRLQVFHAGPNCASVSTEDFSSCFCNGGQIECHTRGVCEAPYGACYPFDSLPAHGYCSDCVPPQEAGTPDAAFAD